MCALITFITRKLKRGGYAPVHQEENGIIPNSYQVVQPPEEDGELGPPDVIVSNEVETGNKKKEMKKNPSIKMKMFTRKNSGKRKSKFEFDENDFDVPIRKISHVKRVAFNPRISRSDWDIYDSRAGNGTFKLIFQHLNYFLKEVKLERK